MPRSNLFRRVPEPVREFVARRAAEGVGVLLLGGALAASLALVSWSARDPSLNHATSGKVRNLLGSGGAIVADLSMQMLGVATIAAILPLALVGSRLLTQRAIHRPLLRCGLWIIGALAAAAVASFLPVTDRWPLPTGLGGVLGDALLALPRRYMRRIQRRHGGGRGARRRRRHPRSDRRRRLRFRCAARRPRMPDEVEAEKRPSRRGAGRRAGRRARLARRAHPYRA